MSVQLFVLLSGNLYWILFLNVINIVVKCNNVECNKHVVKLAQRPNYSSDLVKGET